MDSVDLLRGFGILLIIAGLVVLGGVVPGIPTTELKGIVAVFSILLSVIGYLWYKKVTEVAIKRKITKKRKNSGGKYEYAMMLFLLLTVAAHLLAPVMHLQTDQDCDTETCPTFRTRVITIEYFILGLTMISGLMAFGPILFGRTILGPIFQELQYMAGAMFLLLLFFTLFIFPLHVMFETCQFTDEYGNTMTGCNINVCALTDNGPPLTRFILSMVMPPGYDCGGNTW